MPGGSIALTKQKLLEISLQYATQIIGSNLSRSSALWSYLLYFIPKLTYLALALALTEQECMKIQSPSVMALLPKLHLNRHTARSIVHGPYKYGGLQIPSLYVLQCYGQVSIFLGHIRLGDKTGKLLLICLSFLQLESGSSKPILTQPYPLYQGWLEDCWLSWLWSFLSRVDLHPHVPGSWHPLEQRVHDRSLMENFIALNTPRHNY